MNNNHNGIKTDLRAHPDVFIPRDGFYVDNDDGNYIDDDQPRIRSNSGGSFERTNRFDMVHQTTLSQSYGGDGFSSFLLRQGKGLPSSRAQRYQSTGDRVTISSISYSGYLYKRSNHPHRNPDDLQDRGRSPYDVGRTNSAPELPVMPGIFADPSVGVADTNFHSTMNGPTPNHINNSTVAVTPSPNNTTNTETTDSLGRIKLNQQSTSSPTRLGQAKSSEKNPLQIGLEIGAKFFGITLDNNGNNNNGNSIDQLGGENDGKNEEGAVSNKSQPRVLSTTIDPKWASTVKTVGRPIPISNGSSSHQSQTHSSLHESIDQQHSKTGVFNFNSSTSRHVDEDMNVPQDFYDPEDGHLWRAKFCVLEDGILYFYKNANDGNSAEAVAERQTSKNNILQDDHNESLSSSYSGGRTTNPLSTVISKAESRQSGISLSGRAMNSRRSSAKDLSKSPMVRPGLHPLAANQWSDGDGCIWEKRVFMDCVGGVRTAEQQYGRNSFELQAMDDDELDENCIDTLILKGQNPAEMKEWIFQFHRSLASFMRNFIDSVGSTSNGGILSGSINQSNMLSSRSSHLSSCSLTESGSIPLSSSEKHLQRLISTSPSLQQTLSHGHGRITLKRRMDIKRTPSDSASLSSAPETSDMDYGHHPFAFRAPSPNITHISPKSSSPPVRILIPPRAQHTIPAYKGNAEPMTTGTTIPSLKSGLRNLDLQGTQTKSTDIDRPKPPKSSGKYIPPHLRNKGKYIPPHLRRQQEQQPLGCTDTATGSPSTGQAESSGFVKPPASDISDKVHEKLADRLDIINPSTTGFVRGGCADPLLVKGSILDDEYIPKKASRLKKTAAEAFGSYGGSFSGHPENKLSSLRWEVGAISECGIRDSNEDAYLIANDLLKAFESSSYGTSPQTAWKEESTEHAVGLFGIFDGHCGNQGARFAVEELGRFIHDELRLESDDEAIALSPLKIESVLHEAIVKLDTEFCNLCQEGGREWESGSTAVVAMLANKNLVIASLGDCRGFLCRFVDQPESYAADDGWERLEIDNPEESNSESEQLNNCFWREMTTVHSPSTEMERERIEDANGWITTETEIPMGQLRRMDFHDEDVIGILKRCLHQQSNSTFTESERSTKECKAAPQRIIHISRVCGELAVSRALGDRDFKADFNCSPIQHTGTHDFETKEDSLFSDNLLWESPLFLPYPENHNRQFQGDLVANTPDFHQIQLGTEGVSDEFLLLACDGLWDVMDADDAIRIVRDLLFRKKVTAKKAAARLAELAIHLGSSDNITVLLIRLVPKNDIE